MKREINRIIMFLLTWIILLPNLGISVSANEITDNQLQIVEEGESENFFIADNSLRNTYSGTSRSTVGTTGEKYSPSTVANTSTNKEIDYSFLKTFNYGSSYDDKVTITFNTVKSMKESTFKNLKEGTLIKTKGYYNKNDDGACTYEISNISKAGSIELSNGLYANPLPDKYTDELGKVWYIANVKQYGAIGDGKKADNEFINNTYVRINEVTNADFDIARGIVYIPEGEYKCDNQLHISCKNINFVGDGEKSILFTDNDYRKDEGYSEHFFQVWDSENMYFANFVLEAREVDLYHYMRQFSLIYCSNIYIYNVDMLIPQSCYNNYYYEDKQYSNFCCYSGNKDVTVDECKMVQMTSTYRGANIGILDIWARGEENITIMNCDLYGDARDEQIGFFSKNDSNAYVHNVEFINNTIHAYEPRYSNVVGNATMRFTIGYTDSHDVDGIHIAGNHFIVECDSKFMTFGAVRNCVIEDNIIEVLCTYATWSMVFDSSNDNSENIMVKNNDLFISTKDNQGKGNIIGGNLTFNNNRVFCDTTLPFGVMGNYVNNNDFIFLKRVGRATDGAKEFNNNQLYFYGGNNSYGIYDRCFAAYSNTSADETYNFTNNVIYDYVREDECRGIFQSLVNLAGDIGTLNFNGNKFYSPNIRYSSSYYSADPVFKDEQGTYVYNRLFRKRYGTYNTINVENNTFQGILEEKSDDMFKYSNNTYLPFEEDLTEELTSHVEIRYKGSEVKEITTTESSIDLDDVEFIYDDKEVNNKDIIWYTSVEEIGEVSSEGVVSRKDYGDVYVYAVPLDGSEEVFAKCLVHFEKEKATDISVKEESINLQLGLKKYIEYTVLPEGAVTQGLTFTSSNEAVATVSSIGRVDALSVGECDIICKTTDGSGVYKKIHITVSDVTVKRISIKNSYLFFDNSSIGTSKNVGGINYYPTSATNKTISKWESLDASIATVDGNSTTATVRAIKPGVTDIRAYSADGKCYGTCTVYVGTDPVSNLKVTQVTDKEVSLSWDAVDNTYGYYVYMWNDSTSEWEAINLGGQTYTKDTKCTISNLTKGSNYKFCVRSFITNWSTGSRILYESSDRTISVSTRTFVPVTEIYATSNYLSLTTGGKSIFTINGKEYSNITMKVNVKNNADNKELDFLYDDSIIEFVRVNNNNGSYELYIDGLKEGNTNIIAKAKDGSGTELIIPVCVRDGIKITEAEASNNEFQQITIGFDAVSEGDESKIDGYCIRRCVGYHYEDYVYIPKGGKDRYTYTCRNLPDEVTYTYQIMPYVTDGINYYLNGKYTQVTGTTSEKISVKNIDIEKYQYTIKLGEKLNLTANILPSNVSISTLDWIIEDTDIATVTRETSYNDSGKDCAIITGESIGTTELKLMATDGSGVSKIIIINVVQNNFDIVKHEAKVDSLEELGTKIKLSAAVEGGAGRVKYRFVVCKEGINVYTRAYSSKNYCTWTPKEAGNYIIYFKAKDETGKEVLKKLEYTINNFEIIKHEAKVDSSEELGTKIKLSAAVEGGVGRVKYRFVVCKEGINVYTRAYSSKNYCTWTPKEAGNYIIYFKAKDETGKEVLKKYNIQL